MPSGEGQGRDDKEDSGGLEDRGTRVRAQGGHSGGTGDAGTLGSLTVGEEVPP